MLSGGGAGLPGLAGFVGEFLVLLGSVAARFRDGPLDAATRVFGIVAFSIPVFWLGIILGERLPGAGPVAELLSSSPSQRRVRPGLAPGSLLSGFASDCDTGQALRHLKIYGATLPAVSG